jgi:hypothetical protein
VDRKFSWWRMLEMFVAVFAALFLWSVLALSRIQF